MGMAKILLVDDDPVLGRGLVLNLESEGFKVTWAQSLRLAREAESQIEFDLVVLDLSLPDGSGLEFLRELRQRSSRVGVIILTARTSESEVVEGFKSGANDYVRKPFGAAELLARVRAALRVPESPEQRVRIEDLVIVINKRQVFYKKEELDLNRRQFDILLYLAERPGAVVSREDLLNLIDREGEIFDRTIDSHVSHLRTKLRKSGVDSISVSSVYGVGYRLDYVAKGDSL
jgi:two-component system, OmpR family, response regulator